MSGQSVRQTFRYGIQMPRRHNWHSKSSSISPLFAALFSFLTVSFIDKLPTTWSEHLNWQRADC
ncbi:hypothetical protein D8T51_14720 [Vibrio vulnificus]|nr:hypothetical protein [Vibrio vulnificus]RZP75016.1 hypothetical protein D8T52_15830 [Vibrio vulnificus]RZP75970.1 hypothetical protein D8T51_14720 [Vibrio vulnificus]RZP89797.1 hypothetical protein D8T54_19550 [Vibrio vulnificus]RZP90307.1 hypothetical protein D8T62_09270 [Vibrio vulnificus]